MNKKFKRLVKRLVKNFNLKYALPFLIISTFWVFREHIWDIVAVISTFFVVGFFFYKDMWS